MNASSIAELEANGMVFVGQDSERERMEIMEVSGKCCSLCYNGALFIFSKFVIFPFM